MRHTALAILVALLAGCVDHDPAGVPDAARAAASSAAHPVTVMTRNLFLGAEITPMLAAGSALEVATLAGQMYAEVVANDFTTRARALAREIATDRPHLVGLQEAATFRVQSPGDYLAGNPVAASEVTHDYLELLLTELERLGHDYRLAAVQQGMDVELPMLVSTGLADVRMTLFDAILARADVGIDHTDEGIYATRLELPVAGGLAVLSILRGWTLVDAVANGRSLRFVETHLEAFDQAIQEAQAAELVAVLSDGPAPTVLVGDFNSRPDGSRGQSYGILVDAGFVDVWSRANPSDAGFTCCHGADLHGSARVPDERIDLVFLRDAFPQVQPTIVGTQEAWLVGVTPSDFAAFGIWPSDHAGVVASLRLPAVSDAS